MGAAQSTQKPEQVINAAQEEGTSVEFSPALLQRLTHPSAGPQEAVVSTDDAVRQKLAAESAHLRQKEAEILSAISSALEKENLDKEKPGLSSEILGRDIDEVREKIQRIRVEKDNRENDSLKAAKQNVAKCYLSNKDRPLDCWKEVEAFKNEVSKLESAFVKSLQ